jgi:hypothetical protein
MTAPTYSPLLIVHIVGGLVAIVSGFIALFARKGARVHRRAGDVFVIAMLFMGVAGGYVAFTKSDPANVLAGILAAYLVTTAWLTVKRKPRETGALDVALLCLALAVGAASYILAARASKGVVMYVVFGSIAMLLGAADLRVLVRGGVAGTARLVRHLWRMGLALFVATGSFFLGTAQDPVLRREGLRPRLFTPAIRHTHLPEVPVLVVLVLTLFWMFRVRFNPKLKETER